MKRPYILYISAAASASHPVPDLNSARRISALKNAGARVRLFRHTPGHFISDCIRILTRAGQYDAIMIRIDGSGILDKFTLLKIVLPRWKIYWELHGFPEENYSGKPSVRERLVRFRRSLLRWVYSIATYAVICVSEELAAYAKRVLYMRRCAIIPNFVISEEYRFGTKSAETALDALSGRCIVLWGGSAALPWQALDTIERVAKSVYRKDPSILFVVVGSDHWHTITWHRNILGLSRLPHNEFLKLIRQADICLALYHKPEYAPVYFSPLKILDYMALGKPVIASDTQTIRSFITDGTNGILSDGGISDISEKILRLKRNRALAETMGNRAKKSVMAMHTIVIAQKQYTDLLRRS